MVKLYARTMLNELVIPVLATYWPRRCIAKYKRIITQILKGENKPEATVWRCHRPQIQPPNKPTSSAQLASSQ